MMNMLILFYRKIKNKKHHVGRERFAYPTLHNPSPVGEGWGEGLLSPTPQTPPLKGGEILFCPLASLGRELERGGLSEDRRVGGLEDKLFNVNGLSSKLPIFLPSKFA